MRNARIRSSVSTLAAVLSLCLWAGCATRPARQTDTLSRDEFQILYPRRYFDSLDPLERREVERRLFEEESRTERKR